MTITVQAGNAYLDPQGCFVVRTRIFHEDRAQVGLHFAFTFSTFEHRVSHDEQSLKDFDISHQQRMEGFQFFDLTFLLIRYQN